MPATAKKTVVTTALTPELYEADKEQSLALLTPLQSEVASLTIVDEDDYRVADALFGRVTAGRRGWGNIWTRIKVKSVYPIRQGLEALYQMNRDVDGPFEAMETAIKDKMTAFKKEEARQLRAAEDAKAREERRLQAEADEKQRQIDKATTPQMRGRLQSQQTQLLAKKEAVAEQPKAEPVRGMSSGTRAKLVARCQDIEVMIGSCSNGDIPADVFVVDQKKLDEYYKADPVAVKAWPGVVIEDDIVIVKR